VHAYEWAVVRVVPRVERREFVNAGAVVYCQALDYLAASIAFDEDRARALDPALDVEGVRRHLTAVRDLCAGSPAAGPAAARPPGERWRRLVAPRSTVVQPSPVHTGMTADPAAELERVLRTMVLPPAAPRVSGEAGPTGFPPATL
jgi:hypothetical protein